ncbi:MAG: hypothetical protein ACOZBX_07355 [Campylobacterota bacterium]
MNPLAPLLLCGSLSLYAAEWATSYGLHDTFVNDRGSHTAGADIGVIGRGLTPDGIRLEGDFTLFFEYDHDELDPDYQPVWYRLTAAAGQDMYRFSPDGSLGWAVTFEGKQNTVSGVEKHYKLFAGTEARYAFPGLILGFQVMGGYYILEIDDDVPRNRGYRAGDFRHETPAYTLLAEARRALTPRTDAIARIRQYRDDETWLENRGELIVRYDGGEWIDNATLAMSAEYTRYNLEPYQKAGLYPILPWNDDVVMRVYVEMPWGK